MLMARTRRGLNSLTLIKVAACDKASFCFSVVSTSNQLPRQYPLDRDRLMTTLQDRLRVYSSKDIKLLPLLKLSVLSFLNELCIRHIAARNVNLLVGCLRSKRIYPLATICSSSKLTRVAKLLRLNLNQSRSKLCRGRIDIDNRLWEPSIILQEEIEGTNFKRRHHVRKRSRLCWLNLAVLSRTAIRRRLVENPSRKELSLIHRSTHNC